LPLNATISDNELPFRLFVQVTVSLVCPAIFQEVPKDIKAASGIGQRQRRVLSYIFPSSHLTPASYRGDTDIPFLYSILEKASDLSSKTVEDAIQPVALLPILLPFQRRSVEVSVQTSVEVPVEGAGARWERTSANREWNPVPGRHFFRSGARIGNLTGKVTGNPEAHDRGGASGTADSTASSWRQRS